jgi:TolB protein
LDLNYIWTREEGDSDLYNNYFLNRIQYKKKPLTVKIIEFIKITILFLVILQFAGCTEEKLGALQNGMINGRVLDERTQLPLVNAEIITSPATDTTTTDFMGYFELGNIMPGEYIVIARYPGYYATGKEVLVSANSTSSVIIYLPRTGGQNNSFDFTNNFSPTHNQNQVPLNPVFRWQLGYYPENVSYTLEVFESGSQQAFKRLENLTDTFAIVKGLKFSTNYSWRVTAQTPIESVISDLHVFNTLAFPQNPVIYAKRVDGISQIFVTDINGSSHNQITHYNFHSWRPMVNPQKDRIAFLSTKDINPQLYTMDINGSNVIKLTNIPTGGYYNKGVGFSWLPDGERLVFSSYNRLYRINKDGTGLSLITSINPERHFREVDWSPENDKIVALTVGVNRYDARIVLMNTNGSGMVEIISGLQGALEIRVSLPTDSIFCILMMSRVFSQMTVASLMPVCSGIHVIIRK